MEIREDLVLELLSQESVGLHEVLMKNRFPAGVVCVTSLPLVTKVGEVMLAHAPDYRVKLRILSVTIQLVAHYQVSSILILTSLIYQGAW